LRKWKVKDTAADKRPVFLVTVGGVGKTFSGPLSTTKVFEYFKDHIPDVDDSQPPEKDV
jgi:hypothetical protein